MHILKVRLSIRLFVRVMTTSSAKIMSGITNWANNEMLDENLFAFTFILGGMCPSAFLALHFEHKFADPPHLAPKVIDQNVQNTIRVSVFVCH